MTLLSSLLLCSIPGSPTVTKNLRNGHEKILRIKSARLVS